MTTRDAIKTVLNRNAFYRDGYRLLVRVAMVEAVIILVLVAGLVTMFFSAQVRQIFFATTADGRIINVVPLNEPYIAQGDLIAWAADAVNRGLKMGYHDYQMRLQDIAGNYTTKGWESFLKELNESGRLRTIRERRLIMDVDVMAAPEIVQQGQLNGVYTWVIRVPINVRFEGQGAPTASQNELRLTVMRVSTLQNPRGVAIEQWIEFLPETLQRLRENQQRQNAPAPR